MPTPDLGGLLTKPTRPAPSISRPAEPDDSAQPVGNEETEPAVRQPVGDRRDADRPSALGGRARQRSARKDIEVEARPADSPVVERQYLRSIALYLPRSQHRRVAVEAQARGVTRTALMLAAINTAHQQLGVALAVSDPTDPTELFDIPQQQQPREPSTATTMRVTDRQLAALKALVNQHATSRSRLISVALDLYLNG